MRSNPFGTAMHSFAISKVALVSGTAGQAPQYLGESQTLALFIRRRGAEQDMRLLMAALRVV